MGAVAFTIGRLREQLREMQHLRAVLRGFIHAGALQGDELCCAQQEDRACERIEAYLCGALWALGMAHQHEDSTILLMAISQHMEVLHTLRKI